MCFFLQALLPKSTPPPTRNSEQPHSLTSHYGFNEWVIPEMFKFNFKLLVHGKKKVVGTTAIFFNSFKRY